MDDQEEDDVLAALMRFHVSGLRADLQEAASLVCRVAADNRDLFAVFATELLVTVSERPAVLDSPDVEKVAELLEFLAPYQEALRAIGCIRLLQGRTAEAAELQLRALTAYELNSPGVTLGLARTMDKARAKAR